MEFRILGSVEVADGGLVRDLGGLRERTLLARLLLAAGQVVSADRLAEDLWAGRPPEHYMATLRVYISRLRRALGDGSATVITQPPGYRITLGQSELDADRFAQLVASAREDLAAGRPEVAAAGRWARTRSQPPSGAAGRCPRPMRWRSPGATLPALTLQRIRNATGSGLSRNGRSDDGVSPA